jgi:hypothetical protein
LAGGAVNGTQYIEGDRYVHSGYPLDETLLSVPIYVSKQFNEGNINKFYPYFQLTTFTTIIFKNQKFQPTPTPLTLQAQIIEELCTCVHSALPGIMSMVYQLSNRKQF